MSKGRNLRKEFRAKLQKGKAAGDMVIVKLHERLR
jgi:hypothetical protein